MKIKLNPAKPIPKYYIIKQADGHIKVADNVEQIADYLSSTPAHVKLHIDKPVQLHGWEIKTFNLSEHPQK